jgi:hypothetical protein
MQPCDTQAQTSCSARTLAMRRNDQSEGQLDAKSHVVQAHDREKFRAVRYKREGNGKETSSPGCKDLDQNM